MSVWSLALSATAAIASLIVTWGVREVALRRQLLDHPNDRSAHVRPTPRLGGIGIMCAFLPSAAVIVVMSGGGARALCIVAATALISALGLADDLRPLAARWRFGVQLLAATVVVAVNMGTVRTAWTLLPLPVWLLAPLSVLWIVWVTNLFNFMDGIDGLAGGQAVIGGAAICAAAAAAGAWMQASLALALVAAALGFLLLNFPPASIFMGDVGSTAIGFFLACFPFLPGSAGIPVEVVGLAIALFILDATTTLVRRLARGERFFEAHRTHVYQRPLAAGVPHGVITLSAYPGMAIVGALALAYRESQWTQRHLLVAAAVAIFLGYVYVVASLERRAAGVDRDGASS
ncbi:MraY family glycosyltransferase [Anaeromyxobacter oryzae]|uniref:Glycosyltransferase WbpL n=1 Tax=Anaeromyxobacter oryzae TaxID=2918170 RepID=A0ABM7WV98_9BACT|nr:glycosyltransferase family 4 protein [Anaeromyxobacter oryzae]BDG03431.1 glycosyltransferase WbpL [Anaeromyxobacter oryzae]